MRGLRSAQPEREGTDSERPESSQEGKEVIQRHTVAGQSVRLIVLPRFTRKAFEAWKRFVETDSIFGLDVESTAIEDNEPFDPSIQMRLIQFGNHREAWVLDPHSKWRRAIVEFLNREDRRFVSHNAAFDSTRVGFEFGIWLGQRSIDTLPMASLLWPGNTRRKGLKPLSDWYIDKGLSTSSKELSAHMVDLYYGQRARLPKTFVPGESTCRKPKSKGQPEKCQNPSFKDSLCGYCWDHYLARKPNKDTEQYGWRVISLTDPIFTKYAGLDAIYVRRLLNILNAELKRHRMSALSRTEQRVKRIMTATSVRGHRIDTVWLEPVLEEVADEYDAAETAWRTITGDINPRGPAKADWLVKRGLKFTARSPKTGAPTLDKEHLPELLRFKQPPEIVPALEALEEMSRHANLLTNLRIIASQAEKYGGFAHPQMNTLQAHTGRMSVTGPAMQTFSKKGAKGEKLRGCFIARDGFVFVGADYDSQEIRIAAALSGDPMLNKIVAEDLNQHILTAQSLFEDWIDKEHNPDEYAAAKVLDFAQQYGAGPRKIALQLGVSVAEAKEMWLAWRNTYAGLVAWTDRMGAKPSVRNPFGRVIPADPMRKYANGNYIIQSTGRDVLGQAILRLEDAGWGEAIWLPIHDELVLEVPEDRAEEAAAALTEHMTTTVKGIVIPAEGEVIGPRWRGL